MQARDGLRLQRPIRLPSPLDLASQHGRTAVPVQSQRQPSLAGLADVYLDKAATFAVQAGFLEILMRGDTKFAQTKHLDRWDDAGDIRFVFGYEAYVSLEARADELPPNAYKLPTFKRQHAIKTTPRQQPERVKPEIVRERGYKTIHLLEEMIAEFEYQPGRL